jgi:nicotinamide mononucleotide adenylyltransferase
MKMAKKYIAKEEITTYSINTIEIVAETENEAMEILRNSRGKLLDTEIQEEKLNQRWIDSSEPLDVTEFMKFNGKEN